MLLSIYAVVATVQQAFFCRACRDELSDVLQNRHLCREVLLDTTACFQERSESTPSKRKRKRFFSLNNGPSTLTARSIETRTGTSTSIAALTEVRASDYGQLHPGSTAAWDSRGAKGPALERTPLSETENRVASSLLNQLSPTSLEMDDQPQRRVASKSMEETNLHRVMFNDLQTVSSDRPAKSSDTLSLHQAPADLFQLHRRQLQLSKYRSPEIPSLRRKAFTSPSVAEVLSIHKENHAIPSVEQLVLSVSLQRYRSLATLLREETAWETSALLQISDQHLSITLGHFEDTDAVLISEAQIQALRHQLAHNNIPTFPNLGKQEMQQQDQISSPHSECRVSEIPGPTTYSELSCPVSTMPEAVSIFALPESETQLCPPQSSVPIPTGIEVPQEPFSLTLAEGESQQKPSGSEQQDFMPIELPTTHSDIREFQLPPMQGEVLSTAINEAPTLAVHEMVTPAGTELPRPGKPSRLEAPQNIEAQPYLHDVFPTEDGFKKTKLYLLRADVGLYNGIPVGTYNEIYITSVNNMAYFVKKNGAVTFHAHETGAYEVGKVIGIANAFIPVKLMEHDKEGMVLVFPWVKGIYFIDNLSSLPERSTYWAQGKQLSELIAEDQRATMGRLSVSHFTELHIFEYLMKDKERFNHHYVIINDKVIFIDMEFAGVNTAPQYGDETPSFIASLRAEAQGISIMELSLDRDRISEIASRKDAIITTLEECGWEEKRVQGVAIRLDVLNKFISIATVTTISDLARISAGGLYREGSKKLLSEPRSKKNGDSIKGQVRWVEEKAHMYSEARRYNDGAPGVQTDVKGNPLTPTLCYLDALGEVREVRFDGLDIGPNGLVLVDRKISVTTFGKSIYQVLRQSLALAENGLEGRWEVPNEAEAARATRLFAKYRITNITVKVVPL